MPLGDIYSALNSRMATDGWDWALKGCGMGFEPDRALQYGDKPTNTSVNAARGEDGDDAMTDAAPARYVAHVWFHRQCPQVDYMYPREFWNNDIFSP